MRGWLLRNPLGAMNNCSFLEPNLPNFLCFFKRFRNKAILWVKTLGLVKIPKTYLSLTSAFDLPKVAFNIGWSSTGARKRCFSSAPRCNRGLSEGIDTSDEADRLGKKKEHDLRRRM